MTKKDDKSALGERVTFSVDDVCEVTGLSRSTINKALRDGALPRLKCGHRTLIHASDLEAWLQKMRQDEAA
jgi:excisionase family DNA binding protein